MEWVHLPVVRVIMLQNEEKFGHLRHDRGRSAFFSGLFFCSISLHPLWAWVNLRPGPSTRVLPEAFLSC